MQINRSLLKAAIFLALVPVAVAGMLWSFKEQQTRQQLSPNSNTSTANSSSNPVKQSVHPDEPIDDTLNQRFTFENSLTRTQQIKEALESFRQLTDTSKAKLGKSAIATVKNTDPETQTLGFYNWVGSVEGTLIKQNYQLKKLEFELAQKQYQDKEISQTELDKKSADYRKAEQEFQTFLKSFTIAD
ncbi:hypothetical protein [Microcoleus sp. FACHB-672]|uniref:hypothetical protein n=1 Tax=Microcoleus sp. FACHB-672 TaxID=2692825 RepID=UPI0016861A23|nr:hypothetical protein [Microcoleus sp. FACHB-672]MBD2040795.1 hypothetical protein [Microcoleus sp. FACHB-672]